MSNHLPDTSLLSLAHAFYGCFYVSEDRVTVRVLKNCSQHLFVRNAQASPLVVVPWPYLELSVTMRDVNRQAHAGGAQVAQWMWKGEKTSKMRRRYREGETTNCKAVKWNITHLLHWFTDWSEVEAADWEIQFRDPAPLSVSMFSLLITQWNSCRVHIM